jgi:hypothetical protein
MPARKSPTASSVVPTGRRMKGSEIEAMLNPVERGVHGGARPPGLAVRLCRLPEKSAHQIIGPNRAV